jgi:hypothetical protein
MLGWKTTQQTDKLAHPINRIDLQASLHDIDMPSQILNCSLADRRRLKLDRPNELICTDQPYVHVPFNSAVSAAQVARTWATQIKQAQLAS